MNIRLDRRPKHMTTEEFKQEVIEKRANMLVKYRSFFWRASALRLSLYFSVIVFVIAVIPPTLILLVSPPQHLHHLGLVVAILFGSALVMCAIFCAVIAIAKQRLRSYVVSRLKRYGLTYEQYIKTQYYIRAGRIPAERFPSVNYSEFVQDNINSALKASWWLPVYFLLLSTFQLPEILRHHSLSIGSIASTILFIVLATAYPILIRQYTVPKMRRLLTAL